MMTIIIGTRAQLIKMAPVLLELEARGLRFVLVFTGQHQTTMSELRKEFEIETEPVYLHQGREISGMGRMLFWLPLALYRLMRRRHELFPPRAKYVVVHGDTFSTLLGAVAGRLLRRRVAHVESGLRSFDWRNPFPEELTRLAVFHLATVAFCPGDWACANLSRYRLKTINTGANTLLDTLRFAQRTKQPKFASYPKPYAVVSIHRFENIFSASRFRRIIELLDIVAQQYHLVFVLHPPTRERLRATGLYARLEHDKAYSLVPRMSYLPFIALLSGARMAVTDGGSNQEELSYLGLPTLIMRNATERREGLSANTTLCQFDENKVTTFLEQLRGHTARHDSLGCTERPSARVVDFLLACRAPEH